MVVTNCCKGGCSGCCRMAILKCIPDGSGCSASGCGNVLVVGVAVTTLVELAVIIVLEVL